MELGIKINKLTRVRQEIAKRANSEDLELGEYLGNEMYLFNDQKSIPVVIDGFTAGCVWTFKRNGYENIVKFDINLAKCTIDVTSHSFIDGKLIDLNLVKVDYMLTVSLPESPKSYSLSSQYGDKHNRFSLITATSRS